MYNAFYLYFRILNGFPFLGALFQPEKCLRPLLHIGCVNFRTPKNVPPFISPETGLKKHSQNSPHHFVWRSDFGGGNFLPFFRFLKAMFALKSPKKILAIMHSPIFWKFVCVGKILGVRIFRKIKKFMTQKICI